jgi:hypothetical protein
LDKKILILLPIWKREAITKICFDNLKELQKDFDIQVLCIVSEQWAKETAFKYGFKYVEASNECLGTKMNIGVEESLKYDYDYLMNLGSDDIITKELFKCYKECFDNNVPFFGPTRLIFVDSIEKECASFDYGIMIGAGRCISKEQIKEVCSTGVMYDKLQGGLDMNSMKKFNCSMVEVENDFDTIYDIKSDVNIWAYKDFNLRKPLNFDDAVSGLTTKQIDNILEL